MRFRHATSLALLTIAGSMAGCGGKPFWLLMTPPVKADGQVNIDAPIKSWTTMSHVFGSLSECEQMKKMITSPDSRETTQRLQKMFKNFSQAQADAATNMMSHLACFSSDDPRLAGE